MMRLVVQYEGPQEHRERKHKEARQIVARYRPKLQVRGDECAKLFENIEEMKAELRTRGFSVGYEHDAEKVN